MKTRLFILISIIFVLFSLSAKAQENNALYTKSPLTITDNKITLKLYVNTTHDISGALFPWSFDQNKLKLISIKSSKFTITYKDLDGKYTRNILLDSSKDYNGEVELLEIVFEPTSNFKEGDSTEIRFGSGEVASFQKTSKIEGASYNVAKASSSKMEITYTAVPIVTTLESTNDENAVKQLDSGTEEQNSKQASSNTKTQGNNKSNAIGAIDTGSFIPVVEIIVMGGVLFLIYKKTSNRLYQI